MLNNYTFKPTELPKKYRIQINNIIKNIVNIKTDPYWKNYTDDEFNIDEQTAISVSCDGDDVKVMSTIYHREFFGEGVYRLWNRFLYSKAEKLAEEEKKGLWSSPTKQVTPWRWRERYERWDDYMELYWHKDW